MYFSTFQLFGSRRQLPIFLLETWSAGSRRTQFIMICSHRLASPTSSTPVGSIFCWLATYTRGSIFPSFGNKLQLGLIGFSSHKCVIIDYCVVIVHCKALRCVVLRFPFFVHSDMMVWGTSREGALAGICYLQTDGFVLVPLHVPCPQ